MRNPLLLLATLLLVLPLATGEQGRDGNAMQDRFVGAWRLSWLEEPDVDGWITRDGHRSVQVMHRNAQAASGSVQCNMHKAATRLPTAGMKSMTSTLSPSMLRAAWFVPWSARI